MLAIKVLNKSSNPLPSYETLFAAGMDIRANLDTTVCLKPFERQLIPTGIHIELPQGYEAQIRPRSGLAFKYGISIVNAPGTIDADYRGEIKVLLINLSAQDFIVKHGDRIAQMVVAKHEVVQWTLAQELTETNRGEHGYGHTGIM